MALLAPSIFPANFRGKSEISWGEGYNPEKSGCLEVAAVTRICQDFLTRRLQPDTVARIWRQASDYKLGGLEAECKDLVINRGVL